MLQEGIHLQQDAVATFNPEQSSFICESGEEYNYEWLIVAAGLRLNYAGIEGAVEALEDPNCSAGSMYQLDYAYKFAEKREQF